MKSIRQFRYYGCDENNSFIVNNLPKEDPRRFYELLTGVTGGNIFDSYPGVTKLGIQGRPGTIFYLNESIYPIVIGETGIYEIDLEGYGQIFRIKFDPSSLEWYDREGKGDRLLIDIIYEGQGESA